MKNMGSLEWTYEASQSVFLSVFMSCLFPLEYAFTYAVGNQISNSKYLLELIKRRSKDYLKRTWFKFWRMKDIFRKIWANKSLVTARVYLNSKDTSYLPCQNNYSNFKTSCLIKLTFESANLVNLTPQELTLATSS